MFLFAVRTASIIPRHCFCHNNSRSGVLPIWEMTFLSPSRFRRLNEAVGLLLLLFGLAVVLSLVSYSPLDPSYNTATALVHTHNLLGLFGALWADLVLQVFGISAFLLPVHIWALGWKWLRSSSIESPWFRVVGSVGLWLSIASGLCAFSTRPIDRRRHPAKRAAGIVLAGALTSRFDIAGAAIITAALGIVSIYFATSFELSTLQRWLSGPIARWRSDARPLETVPRSKTGGSLKSDGASGRTYGKTQTQRAAQQTETDLPGPAVSHGSRHDRVSSGRGNVRRQIG